MPSFENLLAESVGKSTGGEKLYQIEPAKKTRAKKSIPKGCEFCPADKQKNVTKLFGRVKGKPVFIITERPSWEENAKGKLLTGEAGEWLWHELNVVGISKEMCDYMPSVRCMTKNEEGKMRPPTKVETVCCSMYNDKAIAKSDAKVYLVFGAVAARQIFGKEYRKDRKQFWSDRLKAKVYCMYHPQFFIQGWGTKEQKSDFRAQLRSAAADIAGKKSKKLSRYSYLEQQDYKGIHNLKDLEEEVALIKKHCEGTGRRITVDLEDDWILRKNKFGKKKKVRVPLVVGMCWKPGRVRVIFLEHPDGRPKTKQERDAMKGLVCEVLGNRKIRKAMHKGNYDVPQMQKLLHQKTRGYDYDTMYADFLDNPGRMSYGLTAIADARVPEFSTYKSIVMPEAAEYRKLRLSEKSLKKVPKNNVMQEYTWFAKRNLLRLSHISKEQMILYNGGDCDVTKRIEVATKKNIDKRLLKILIDAAYIVDDMEKFGPLFDFKHLERLKKLYPPQRDLLLKKLRKMAGNPNLNPKSPKQLKEAMYQVLNIPYPLAQDKRTGEMYKVPFKAKKTNKPVLEILSRKYEFPRLLIMYRKLEKICSTYINSFEECALAHDGRLRTKWWLTGTRTTRLSSGGGKGDDASLDKIVNLQNVHGDKNLQDLLVADLQWKQAYKEYISIVEKCATSEFVTLGVVLSDIFDVKKSQLKKEKKEERLKELGEKKKDAYKELKDALHRSSRYKKLFREYMKKWQDLNVYLGYDFGQIEVRVMAQLSDDEQLIADCLAGDIHSRVGHNMTGWSIEKIKSDKLTRTLTKNIHFGILFGLGKNGLYAFIKIKDPDTKITPEKAGELYDKYFETYQGVAEYVIEAREFAKEHGYCKTAFGFKRPLHIREREAETDDIIESDRMQAGNWATIALNTPVQGTAHQLMFMALATLKRKKKKYKLLGTPQLEVHDAIYFVVALKNLLQSFKLGKELLTKEPLRVVKREYPEIKWKVPLEVEGKGGLRLGSSVELEGITIEEFLENAMFECTEHEIALKLDLKYNAA